MNGPIRQEKLQAVDIHQQDHCKNIYTLIHNLHIFLIEFGFDDRPNSVTKTRDHTIETSKEQYERENSTLASRDNHSRTPDNTKSDHNNPNRRTERRSERQRIKRQIFANGQSELKDNGQIDHKLQSTTPEIAMTSDYSFEEGDRDDTSPPPTSAYEIYKQSGEWWK